MSIEKQYLELNKKKFWKKINTIILSLFLILSDTYADKINLSFFKKNWKIQIKGKTIFFKAKENIDNVPFLWIKDIYIAIDKKPFWEYKWFEDKWWYILIDHKLWAKKLKFSKWKSYGIVLKKNNIHLIKINKDPKETFKKYEKTKIPEKLKQNIINYINKIEFAIKKTYKNKYITFIDTKLNRLFLIFSDKNWSKEFIWESKVSTWNPHRWKDYFNTPYIIVDRKKTWFFDRDWRALWTDTKWYWEKWNRIFFLWKYFVNKDKDISLIHKKWYHELHLAFHTTTPWWLTQLWKAMSKWCIRTDRIINKLYDKNKELNEGIFIIWNMKENFIYYITDNNNLKKISILNKSNSK